MNEVSKKRTREIYGINQVKKFEDSDVIKRRKYHIAAARWLARWVYYLRALFFIIGLVFLLLPAFGLDWYPFVFGLQASYVLTSEFDFLYFCYFFIFIVSTALNVVLGLNVKHFPGGWDPARQFGLPTPKQVFEFELYPSSRHEEFVFWVNYVFGIFMSTWSLLVIGLITFLIMG